VRHQAEGRTWCQGWSSSSPISRQERALRPVRRLWLSTGCSETTFACCRMPLNVPESRQNSRQMPKTPGIARLSPPACPGGGPPGPRTFAPFPLISSGPARIPGPAGPGFWPWRAILPGYRPGGRALDFATVQNSSKTTHGKQENKNRDKQEERLEKKERKGEREK
jgi:hypothetical protein